MKKTIFFLMFSLMSFSQHSGRIAQKIAEIQKSNATFEKKTIFTETNIQNNNEFSKTVDNATLVQLDFKNINDIANKKYEQMEVEIPHNGKTLSVLLFRVDILAQNFQVDTDKQKNLTVEQGVFYRGIFKNDSHSVVSFNFFKNQMSAVLSNSRYGNLVIGKLETPNNIEKYIIYEESKLKINNNFTCSTVDEDSKRVVNSLSSANSARCATIYFEMDFSLYVANGSSTSQSTIWMTSVFNNVQTLFQNDGITTAIQSLFIWTTQDPYTGTSSLQNLNTFRQVRPVFNGDVGQLVGIDGGFGGLARAVNGICNIYNYSYSDVNFAFQAVPLYSWTINLIAHELGHLFGSEHTHGCFWNGNNTAIDGCGPTANAIYAEGTCPTGPVPTSVQKGTIMSYCFLLNNVGINFANGFGPQPSARMLQNINASACLSTNCVNTCISQISNITLTNSATTSLSISFTDGNTANTQWQYSVTAFPFTNPIWITINSTAVTTPSNLAANTYYKVCVRPICPSGVVVVPNCAIFTTNDDFCAGRPFTDTGGTNNSYQDNESWVRTVVPIGANNKLRVVFSSIDIELDYDFLRIYNGLTASSPNLTPNGITGSTTPEPFQSTDTSGALTFKFESDGNTIGNGWNAIFNCTTLGTNDNAFIDYSYYPNPVKNEIDINSKSEIQSISVFTIDGKLIYSDNKKLLKTTISMQEFAKGTYIFRIEFENKPITFKVLKD
jgi:hypothetical protein